MGGEKAMAKEKKKTSATPEGASTDKWFSQGEAAIPKHREKEQEVRSRQRKGKAPYRLNPGETGELLLMDDALAFLVLHKGKIRGKFYTKTCMGDADECTYCMEEVRAVPACIAGTAINMKGFKGKDDGEMHRFYKQPLIVTGDGKDEYLHQRELLKEKKGEKFTMRYTLWEVRRSKDQKSPACGTSFTLKKKFKNKEAVKEYLLEQGAKVKDYDLYFELPDYREAFRPETPKQAEAFLGISSKQRTGEDDDYDEQFDESGEENEDSGTVDEDKDIDDELEDSDNEDVF
jgi:hypothetical protein